jgi:two-component system, cell cycle response regulator
MKVLIAEDDPVTRRLLESSLKRWGYEPVLAEDGVLAWMLLQREDAPELAVLDWMMPGLSGVEICQRLRARKTGSYVYIVLVTSRGEKDDFVEGMEAGADDYLVKPYSPYELQQRLRAGARVLSLQTALREQATLDSLTTLWNRRSILEILNQERSRARREGRPLALALADIDHFKLINDTYGHITGDHVLQEIARRMRSCARDYDSVGRYGGEEFLFVLPGCNGPAADCFGQRLRRAMYGKPILSDHLQLSITISIGVHSLSPCESAPISDLIQRADTALYRAKRNGRNRVVAYTPGLDLNQPSPTTARP